MNITFPNMPKNQKCSFATCPNKANGRYCRKHFLGKALCIHSGCIKPVEDVLSFKCKRHANLSTNDICSVEQCNNLILANGKCQRHYLLRDKQRETGSYVRKRGGECSVDQCTNSVRLLKDMHCEKHSQYLHACAYKYCRKDALFDGFCHIHQVDAVHAFNESFEMFYKEEADLLRENLTMSVEEIFKEFDYSDFEFALDTVYV